MTFLKYALQAIFQSKKATAALAGVVLTLLAPFADRIGWDLTQSQVTSVLVLLGSFIIGQGIADAGKERARLELAYREGANAARTRDHRDSDAQPEHVPPERSAAQE